MEYEKQGGHLPIGAEFRGNRHRSPREPKGASRFERESFFFRHYSNSSGQRSSQSETASRARISTARGLIPGTPRSSALYWFSVSSKNLPGTSVLVAHAVSSSPSRSVFFLMTSSYTSGTSCSNLLRMIDPAV